jgi:hypothetical protein
MDTHGRGYLMGITMASLRSNLHPSREAMSLKRTAGVAIKMSCLMVSAALTHVPKVTITLKAVLFPSSSPGSAYELLGHFLGGKTTHFIQRTKIATTPKRIASSSKKKKKKSE